MNKKQTLIFILIALSVMSPARSDAREHNRNVEFTAGIEWGYTSTLQEIFHYNFITDESMRVDLKGSNFHYFSNGHVLAKVGLRYFNHFDTTFNMGYCGIQEGRSFISYALRESIYYKGYRNNGLFNIMEAGEGGSSTFQLQPIYFGKLGMGYRFKISQELSIDALMSFQMSKDHPKSLIDRKTDTEIYYYQLRRSDVLYSAVNFSISLNF